MSYKSRLGITEDILSTEIDAYFRKLGFYVSVMKPDIVDEDVCAKLVMDAPALQFDARQEDRYIHVYMNANEVYVEHLDKVDSSLICGNHHVFSEPPKTIEEVEDVLNKLV